MRKEKDVPLWGGSAVSLPALFCSLVHSPAGSLAHSRNERKNSLQSVDVRCLSAVIQRSPAHQDCGLHRSLQHFLLPAGLAGGGRQRKITPAF